MTNLSSPIILVERDLLFASKIREPLKSIGMPCFTAKTPEEVRGYLARPPRPAALVIHFGGSGLDWQQIIIDARAAGIPVLAYGSHVDTAAQNIARAAGATRVVANSKLAGNVLYYIQRTINHGSAAPATEDE